MVRSDPCIASRTERYALGISRASGATPRYADRAGHKTLGGLLSIFWSVSRGRRLTQGRPVAPKCESGPSVE